MIKVKIPGSKSITQRALICASLANGISILKNPLFSEDTELLINGLKCLGIKIKKDNTSLIVNGNSGKFKSSGKKEIYMGNNGTGLRFLIALSCFYPDEVIITGNNRMKNRPVNELVDALNSAGFSILYIENRGYPPVLIKGNLSVEHKFKSKIKIKSTKSSQFVSAILLAGVLFKNGLILEVNENIPSKPYIDITLQVMKYFGVEVGKNSSHFTVYPSSYESKIYNIEGDFSSASYFMALPFFSNNEVLVENLNYNYSFQPDKKIIDILKKMGAEIDIKENSIIVKPSKLNGIEIDMNECPDIVPTVAVISSISEGETIIKNIKHLRYKESDRIFAIEKNLKKFGINVKSGEDFLIINGDREKIMQIKDEIVIETFDDHRIAMSFALFKLSGLNIKFDNQNCVKKSFPQFWEMFNLRLVEVS